MSQEELNHYKHQCLALSIALHRACEFATFNDRDRTDSLFEIFLKGGQDHINAIDPNCIDEMLQVQGLTP